VCASVPVHVVCHVLYGGVLYGVFLSALDLEWGGGSGISAQKKPQSRRKAKGGANDAMRRLAALRCSRQHQIKSAGN